MKWLANLFGKTSHDKDPPKSRRILTRLEIRQHGITEADTAHLDIELKPEERAAIKELLKTNPQIHYKLRQQCLCVRFQPSRFDDRQYR